MKQSLPDLWKQFRSVLAGLLRSAVGIEDFLKQAPHARVAFHSCTLQTSSRRHFRLGSTKWLSRAPLRLIAHIPSSPNIFQPLGQEQQSPIQTSLNGLG